EFESFHEDAKSLPCCIEAFEKYFTHFGWKSDPIQPAVFNNQPAIEYTFSIPLEISHPETSEPILYTGRYDMIGIYNDQLFIVDEKTCKQLGPTWGNNWRLRSQITGYCWAAHQFEYPVAGAIIRGICFTKEIKFAESIQFRDKWEIERWYEQLNRDIEKMIKCWEDDYWDFNLDTSCTNYGGCQFIDICKAKHAKKWLDSEFTIREWNPLNKD
ncbi:MAG: PD-(D/E)XK nuclease family protein, partial [Planctomycetes bacterium]|nr:PD-(D/E)XK nuclease family protein [Planctomycetota bacterium]